MIETLSAYSTTSKTAEIMSRYRPIAPKPEVPMNSMSESLWPQLQARPTRTRKRGRISISPFALKRRRTHVLGLTSASPVTSSVTSLPLQVFTCGLPQHRVPNFAALNGSLETSAARPTTPASLVSLPFLPCPPSVPVAANQATICELNCLKPCGEEKVIDLNTVAEIPEEKDLLQLLQGHNPTTSNIIAPQPVRPVGSSISVGCISEDARLIPAVQVPKKPEEIEEDVESETLPAVISDSNNKVRLANSAYKEMVGQPECSWLHSMVTGEGRSGGSSCKRISGEVMLQLLDSKVPVSSNGFSCWVRIEWESDGKKSSVKAYCDVIKISCESKDYLFTWRFHTNIREASHFSSSV